MAAAVGIVVGQGEVETSIAIEVDELHAVSGIVLENHVRQRFSELCAVDEQRIAIQRLAGNEVADVEVRPAVVVQIAPGGGDAVAVQVDAALAGYFAEAQAAVISIERA